MEIESVHNLEHLFVLKTNVSSRYNGHNAISELAGVFYIYKSIRDLNKCNIVMGIDIASKLSHTRSLTQKFRAVIATLFLQLIFTESQSDNK